MGGLLEIGHLHQRVKRFGVQATLDAADVSMSTYRRWLKAKVEAPVKLLSYLHDAGHLTADDVAGLLRHGLSRASDG